MRITLIGYGRMGREVEKLALARGHEVILRIDRDNTHDFDSDAFAASDTAIEFTCPETAFDNISRCIKKGVPVVSGTTGWTGQLALIRKMVEKEGGTFLYASNFSIGMNILFNLNRRLADIMNKLHGYRVSIEETHHTMKKDAPSGTAISLAEDIINGCTRYESWKEGRPCEDEFIGIKSIREGQVTGTHRIDWTSDIDTLTLQHMAHKREGFAHGAVFAAEYIRNRKGVFTMNDLLGF
ncbi:MAG: 4-hydroxy-tetrahydrodipicolinate reductase [Bacteroidales bacterium]|nr:4-hydroxy-tetrahydrodipicolinate reductase [Bacteroidales bacterium]